MLSLRREAIKASDSGEHLSALRDLSIAIRIIIECEPRQSLEDWVAWLELEREILKELESTSSRYALSDTHSKWYESALAKCPKPNGQKFAGLLLNEQNGWDSILSERAAQVLVKRNQNHKSLSPGRSFLATLKGLGQVVAVEPLKDRIIFSKALAQSPDYRRSLAAMDETEMIPLGLTELFERVESNYSFRKIAISAFKVKRAGMAAASPELDKLRDSYGYQVRLDSSSGGREALKWSRLSDSGQLIEMEWVLTH